MKIKYSGFDAETKHKQFSWEFSEDELSFALHELVRKCILLSLR